MTISPEEFEVHALEFTIANLKKQLGYARVRLQAANVCQHAHTKKFTWKQGDKFVQGVKCSLCHLCDYFQNGVWGTEA